MNIMGSKRTCEIGNCNKAHVAKGMCRSHYSRKQKYGDPEYISKVYFRYDPICKIDDCNNPHYSKGYCQKHYARLLIHGDPNVYLHRHVCSVESCNKKHNGNGFCAMHRARWKIHGSPYLIKEVRDKGRIKHRLYTRYRGMIERCYREKAHNYARYGGRGIKVCPEWLDIEFGFERYVECLESLDNAYKDNWTIDRIDNDGNYEPSNVQWASISTQNSNQRRSKS